MKYLIIKDSKPKFLNQMKPKIHHDSQYLNAVWKHFLSYALT